jgi:hypothetical protein
MMKSSSSMVPITFENRWGLLEVPYMSSMSHTSGTNTIVGSSTLEYDESSSNVHVGGVGG